MYIMLVTAVLILIVNTATFWFPMWPIKLILVIQAIQMTLTSFSSLNPAVVIEEMGKNKLENYMAMNIIIAVFSTMCVTFNGILINTIYQDNNWKLRYALVAGIFGMNVLCILFTKFVIHD